ncbi:MAG TPA: Gfo/Idh/MocA family oxidoreductase [Candidatus Hydrogenedentes bacterium]|jgi:predicted dehydrogenase|nr:MAG: Inositol 2-dehydrogenase [Candidatus Hydrogenedentes bacterium ADurb.Bin170]HNZ47653.1 Gfo/Idh/MocA family oxidoreductase [Candidatus Hydrogenedentota bacterium]HOD96452.1 Gfo/Idh/MocA family oxidoreductase [Candidatus Hydrogenedentota bacterium]HOH42157.1 Gfo/Idh/MocA family oxidoreductase [Candidatus Hydrogenedentota bacterium]HOM48110.1 Gfo/Idh/MocA family oxidoreductase [Candidatus Hydrogenedentota bacterium]
MEKKPSNLSRRDFAKASAAAGFAILASRSGQAQDSAETLKIGLIGCGGRGCGAAVNCLTGNDNVKLVALADVFEDSVIKAKANLERNNDPRVKNKLAIEEELCFHGLDAYQKLLETDVDIVIHATPPYCRPMHLEAIVAAGKHLFSEKPFAVDSPGIRRCLAAAKVADEKGLTFVTGLQRRYQDKYLQTIEKLQGGEIGEILYARVYWNGNLPFCHDRLPDESDLAYRLRNWYNYIWTCGDNIVEQHVHNIDVINWLLGAYPVKVVSNGGRAWKPAEEKYGDIWDNFACDFEYANGVHMLSMSRHWNNSKSDVWERVVGTKGKAACGDLGRDRSDPYVNEHIAMLQSIRGEIDRINDGERTAYSTLTAIMGREAAYTGQEVTWEQALNCEKSRVPADLDFAKSYPVGPIPVPGA